MWIIPKNLQLSSGAPDTAGFISDLNEQSQICASSLMVRSKPSQPRIWSQKWRRDSWTQHLSGRILKPSHAKPFETEWTCLWPVIPASHFQQQESGSEPKTLATSGRTSQEQLELFALDSVSSRMSKDTSASDSAKSSETWEQSVTRRRGEYSLRLKSARLTSASASSSWPTISVNESKNSVGKSQLDRNSIPLGTMVAMQQNLVSSAAMSLTTAFSENTAAQTAKEVDWRTPTTEAMGTGAHMDSADLKLGHRVYNKNGKVMAIDLNRQMDIVQRMESPNWPTPDASNHRDGAVLRTDNNLEQGGFHGVSLHHAMTKYGQAAPANPSTLGSRQGLWLTPRANEPDNDPNFAARNADRGAHCHGTLSSQAKQLWPTITAHTPDMESNGPNGHTGTYLAGAVKAEENWVTPRTSGTSTRPNKTTPRQGLTLIEQARANEWRTPTVAEEKNQNTSKQVYLQNQVGAVQKQWATPIQGDSHLASTPEVAQKRIEEGKVTLSRQNPGKLNPRWVETLMGLPVGWVMPSCKSPVTIELTNGASSATESSQQQQNEHSELFGRNSQND